MRTLHKVLFGLTVLAACAVVIGLTTAPLRAQDSPPAPPGAGAAVPAAEAGGMAPEAAPSPQGGPGLTPPVTPPLGGGTQATPPAGQAGPAPIAVAPTPPAADHRTDADRQRAEFRADIARRKHPWDKQEMYENEAAWERNVQQNDYNWAPAHKDTGGQCGSTWWREYCGND